MSDGDRKQIERLQAVMTALLKRRLAESLANVETAIQKWRMGELGVFETHAALLKHAARAERMAERMARVGAGDAGSLLRDAFDAGLLEREEFEELVGCPPEDIAPSPEGSDEPRAAMPGKRELVEELLGAGPVLVHIDARREEVRVPDKFRDDAKLVLRFGYGLTPAIVDLGVDDRALSGTLTFGGVPHRCILPWPAVYAVVSEVDQKGMVWPEDVPPSVVDQLTAESTDDSTDDSESPSTDGSEPKKPHLTLVK